MEVYFAGLTSGTWKNKSVQANKYVTFAAHNKFVAHAPSQYDVLTYILHLKESLGSPGAVLNYLSGAKTWVQMHGGEAAPFDTYSTGLMKRGVRRLSSHVPRPAPPITSELLRQVVAYLRTSGPVAGVLVAALSLGFASLLRQGNLLGPVGPGSTGHGLRCRDIVRTADGLTVTVRSTKTRWRSSPALIIRIPHQPECGHCPVAAWDTYAAANRPPPCSSRACPYCRPR